MDSIFPIALPIIYSMLLVNAAYVAGRVLRLFLRRTDEFVWQRRIIDYSLGFGVISLAIFMLGVLHLLYLKWMALGYLVVIALDAWFFYKDKSASRKNEDSHHSLLFILIFVIFMILFLTVMLPSLAPSSMGDWDSLSYHLAVPKLYIQHHGFYYINTISHSNFPMLVEMLYLPMLMIGQLSAAKLIHFIMGILLVGAIGMMVRKHFNPKAAPLASIAFAGMPIVLWLATTAYIDLATALYTVLSVYFLLEYLDKPERSYLIAAGIAAGFAASTKMTGLSVIPLILGWLLVDRFFSEKRVFEWKRGLMFIGVALLVCSPWYIKSIIYTGNPVYPFFYSIFGGRDWTSELAKHYATQQSLFGMGHDFASFMMLPFNLTFHSERFYDTPGLFVGPIFPVALPLLFTVKYRSRKLIGLVGFFVASLVIWFGLTQQSRYLIPAFAILAVIIAAIVYSDEKFRIARIAVWGASIITAFFGVWTLVPAIAHALPLLSGHITQDEYLSRTLDIYPADKWMNEHLPKKAKVALCGDNRGFYLDRNYMWADPGHNKAFTREYKSPQDMVRYWKSQGITHVMINYRFYPKRGKGDLMMYRVIDEGLFEEVYSEGDGTNGVAVYRII